MERAYGLEIPQNLGETCNPRHTALLVYDMQVGIIGQIQGGPALVARVKELLETVRAVGFSCAFSCATCHSQRKQAGVFQLRTAMAWQRVRHPSRR